MSKRFAIRSTRPPEQKDGNKIVFGTGEQVPFRHSCELYCRLVDKDQVEYITGLEPRHIQYSKFFDDERKKILLKEQGEAVKELANAYGKNAIRPDNQYFWNEHNSLVIDNETMSSFFDTKDPKSLMTYWSIMGGGYADEIGPTYDDALAYGLPFYMTELNEEAERRTEPIGDKVEAMAKLSELNNLKSNDDMLWLAWILHPSQSLGYTKSTAKATLFAAHYQFIEGVLVKKAKKACSKQFLDAYTLLKTNKTEAIARAVFRAADYFGLIFTNKDGKLQTRNGVILGDDQDQSVDILLKPINHGELEILREDVEAKLK